MTDCGRYIDMLSAMADGELTAEEAGELMAHVAVCPSCGALLDLYREASEVISGDAAEPPPALRKNVMAAVTAPKRRAKIVRIAAKYLAVAACVTLIIFVAPRLGNLGCGGSSKSSDFAPPQASAAPEAPYSYTMKEESAPAESAADAGTDNMLTAGTGTQSGGATELPEDVALEDYYAVVTVYGDAPDILEISVFEEENGVLCAVIAPEKADELADAGYYVEYGEPDRTEALVLLYD